jgi:NTP pyrophosphatase (non-canonical NTP hydrolase)
MISVDQYKIAQFNNKHDVTEDAQFRQLVEEIGELAEAYNREAGDEVVGEELADVLFVARSLAELREINVTGILDDVIDENAQKDTSIKGQKVTKDGLVPAVEVVGDEEGDAEDSEVRGKWGVTDDD